MALNKQKAPHKMTVNSADSSPFQYQPSSRCCREVSKGDLRESVMCYAWHQQSMCSSFCTTGPVITYIIPSEEDCRMACLINSHALQ